MNDKWEQRYNRMTDLEDAASVLSENLHLLPERGRALDLACGASGNGALLARQGLETHLWDSAAAALALQEKSVLAQGLKVTTAQRDCEDSPPEAESFDVICVCHFLHRESSERLVQALRPGGLLFYQTFHNDKVSADGPSRDEFLLRPNELLQLFSALEVRYYREDGRCGNLAGGERNRAYFVGQKI